MSAAAERLRLRQDLAEAGECFRDAARRRRLARDAGDPVGEATAEQAIEATFRARDRALARLADLEPVGADVP